MSTNYEAGVVAKLALLGAVAVCAAGHHHPQKADKANLPNDQFPSSINLSHTDHVGHQPNVVIVGMDGSLYNEGTNCVLLPSNKSLITPEGIKPSELNLSGATRGSATSSKEKIQDIVIVCEQPFKGGDDHYSQQGY